MEATKKERIIELARKNPFWKIEQIAEEVGTSKMYVRTSLSESNISLIKEREKYVKCLEKEVERLKSR